MITPQEKAIDLIEKFGDKALMVLAEIMNSAPTLPIQSRKNHFADDVSNSRKWWLEVKDELEFKNYLELPSKMNYPNAI